MPFLIFGQINFFVSPTVSHTHFREAESQSLSKSLLYIVYQALSFLSLVSMSFHSLPNPIFVRQNRYPIHTPTPTFLNSLKTSTHQVSLRFSGSMGYVDWVNLKPKKNVFIPLWDLSEWKVLNVFLLRPWFCLLLSHS